MAKKSAEAAAPNRRGSPEAVAKRRAGRAFNDLLDPGARKADGRTEKRRQRLRAELEAGQTKQGRALKPLDVLSHANELLELGEDPAELRRIRKARPARDFDERLLDVLGELHQAYGFRVEVYALLGIDDDALKRAGVVGPKRRARKARATTKSPARTPEKRARKRR